MRASVLTVWCGARNGVGTPPLGSMSARADKPNFQRSSMRASRQAYSLAPSRLPVTKRNLQRLNSRPVHRALTRWSHDEAVVAPVFFLSHEDSPNIVIST